MNLFLSRLCLNPMFAPALKLAADPYELHRKLLNTLSCAQQPKPATGAQPKTANLLFRVDTTDTGPTVLLQTGEEPEWDLLELAPRAIHSQPETKPFAPKFSLGMTLDFRLISQPSIRKSGQFGLKANGKRILGPRRACRDDGECLTWLKRKSESCGFIIETVSLTHMDWRNTKPLQKKGGSPTETQKEARKRAFGPGEPQRLGAIRFDGVLGVSNPEALCKAIQTGIGPQKAFGFGLLSIAPNRP